MRFFRLVTSVALFGLISMSLAGPAGALAVTRTQTVTTNVTVLCTVRDYVLPGLPQPPPVLPPQVGTVPVTLTVPLRVHSGTSFTVHLVVAGGSTVGLIGAAATLLGLPGLSPTVGQLTVIGGADFAGDLGFFATGPAGTVTNWQLTFVGAVFATTSGPMEGDCTPTTPNPVLASTRIVGPKT